MHTKNTKRGKAPLASPNPLMELGNTGILAQHIFDVVFTIKVVNH